MLGKARERANRRSNVRERGQAIAAVASFGSKIKLKMRADIAFARSHLAAFILKPPIRLFGRAVGNQLVNPTRKRGQLSGAGAIARSSSEWCSLARWVNRAVCFGINF
jgi:hypothetical protein